MSGEISKTNLSMKSSQLIPFTNYIGNNTYEILKYFLLENDKISLGIRKTQRTGFHSTF